MGKKRQAIKARQRARLQESAVAESTSLEESGALTLGGGGGQRRRVTVIQAGWGSSGYYSKELLERDGPEVWPAGTHMYLNHPGQAEATDRPERDLRDLVGVIHDRPVMEGDSLVATAAIFEHWAPLIEQLAPHIGVSIRANGEIEEGEAEGRTGPIVRKLSEGLSVDFVTKAGAGGKVGELVESARANVGLGADPGPPAPADPLETNLRDERAHEATTVTQPAVEADDKATPVAETSKEDDMSDAEKEQLARLTESAEELQKRVEALETEVTAERTAKERAEDALLRVHAERVVAEATVKPEGKDEAVSAYEGLPDRAVSRIKEAALRGELPLTEDGKLDESKLVESAVKASQDEREYLRLAGAGTVRVTNMGESASTSETDEPKGLASSFQRLGLSEKAATIAAEGR